MSISRGILRASFAMLILAGLSLDASAVELAINGGFEAGDTSDWVSFPSGSSTFTAESVSPNTGSFNGKLENTATGSAAVIKQANVGVGTVTPGQDITINFWARGSAEAGGVHFAELFSELDGGGTSKSEILSGAPLFPPSDTTWTEYTFNTTLGPDVSGGVTLQFNAATGANLGSFSILEIDDVSISVAGIPEPTSLALLSLAGLGLAGRRRR
ncbi:carbohydrate binding domain-containing protein [Adhaeretor mobilis]|uniref:Carbohydrate binding domain protein n=1 Tax=Adhaeretor mobilis TaxID=1930276 RepID=A0A517MYD8_9BACT|nr:carbohydrate binding domain-containing protein [Adhaeretor mobilis]QDS99900.1 Carbohydrate binding domain protein [Adhaeretor mobilis]